MKNIQTSKNLLNLLLALCVLAVTSSARATLSCNTWNSGSSSGQSVFSCDFYNGSTSGTYGGSYNCQNNRYYNYCTISYSGGNSYQGACSIVFKCVDGSKYYCDIKNWDGKETIRCDYIPRDCKEIYVCQPGPTPVTSIPEPSTVVAAVLLLIPFGISTMRILRRHKAAQSL